MNKITKLTPSDIRDIMPYSDGDIVGGIQIGTPSIDAWPTHAEMEAAAKEWFGADARLGQCDEDESVVTWVVVRA